MHSRIEPMKKIARSLRQHRELILNYFRDAAFAQLFCKLTSVVPRKF